MNVQDLNTQQLLEAKATTTDYKLRQAIDRELEIRAKAHYELYDDEPVIKESEADKFVRTHEIKDIMGNDYLKRVEHKFLHLLDTEGNDLRLAVTINMKNGDKVLVRRAGDYSFRDCSGDRFSIKVNDGKFSRKMNYKDMINFIGYYGK